MHDNLLLVCRQNRGIGFQSNSDSIQARGRAGNINRQSMVNGLVGCHVGVALESNFLAAPLQAHWDSNAAGKRNQRHCLRPQNDAP